ncbi:MAG: ComEC/Rec2 family competence protein [Bacteroidia bacterium]
MQTPGHTPLFHLALCLTAGIFLSRTSAFFTPVLLPAGIVFLLFSWKQRSRKSLLLKTAAFYLVFIGLGSMLMQLEMDDRSHSPDLFPYMCTERHLKVIADSKPVITSYNRQLDASVLAVWTDSLWEPVGGRIRLRIPLDDSIRFQQWDSLEVYAWIRDYHVSDEGYQHYLHQQDIFHLGYVKRIIGGGKHLAIRAEAARIQQSLSQKIGMLIKDPDSRAIAQAMLLGDKSRLNRELKQAFATAGLSHVLAISGLHVGLVFLLLNMLVKPLKRFRGGNAIGQGLVLAALLGYMLITGAMPAVCRAVLMFGMVTLARLFGKRVVMLNILGASAMIQLCVEPSVVFQLGFQLSYLAVSGIVLLLPWFEKISFTGIRLIDGLYAWIAVSVAATLFTAPLTISTFGVFPTHFILANLLVSLLVSAAVLVGFSLVLLHWLPGVNTALGWLCNQTMMLLQLITEWVAGLPGAQVRSFSIHDEGLKWLLIELAVTAMLLLLPKLVFAIKTLTNKGLSTNWEKA